MRGLLIIFGTLFVIGVNAWKRDEPQTTILELPAPYGTLKGKIRNTSFKKNPYKVFRNIPYAEPITKETRFQQPEMFSESRTPLGSKKIPYDATKTGPICAQNEMDPDQIIKLLKNNNLDMVKELIGMLGLDDQVPPPEDILNLVGELFNIQNLPLKNLTLYETVKAWLDVDFGMSEDCLHLTVSTPNKPLPEGSKGFPVMFFVHGGGFSSGTHLHSEADRLGDVADVVVVSINYRVGILGFLCLDSDESAGNQGMLDILLALEWVQKYIHHFGGDKDRVTIFGESAGSATIGHLLLSPATRDTKLFKYGIGQSGSAISPWAFDRNPRKAAYEFAKRMKCKVDEGDDAIVQCLRKFEAWELTSEFSKFTTDRRKVMDLGFGGSSPCPQTKGKKIFYGPKDDPMELLTNKNYNTKVPILFGANLYEGIYAYNLIYNTFIKPNGYDKDNNRTRDYLKHHMISDLNRASGIKNGYTVENLVKKEYFPQGTTNLEQIVPGLIDYLGVQLLKASSYHMMSKHSKNGGTAYWYSFEYHGEKSMCHTVSILTEAPFVDQYGTCHADELIFMFDYELPLVLCDIKKLALKAVEYFNVCKKDFKCVVEKMRTNHRVCLEGILTEEEKDVAITIAKAWTNFAKNGDPNGEGLPVVKPWREEYPEYIIYNKVNKIDSDYFKKYILGDKLE